MKHRLEEVNWLASWISFLALYWPHESDSLVNKMLRMMTSCNKKSSYAIIVVYYN
jgi:hypothetical protein